MTQWSAPAPKDRVYVVGDIHGREDLLGDLLAKIDEDMAPSSETMGTDPSGTTSARMVFVGDYIDRGDASADVLRFVAQAAQDNPDEIIALMGNHERMMLDFLADPTGPAERWLRFGGLQTLVSFGVGGALATDSNRPEDLIAAAGDLRDAAGPELVNWLTVLPLSWSSGTLWVVHAGADPAIAMEAQPDKALLWGAERFGKSERQDGQWVAFGHEPFAEPFARAGRIAVDTGAVYGGKLTAARIDPGGAIGFLSA